MTTDCSLNYKFNSKLKPGENILCTEIVSDIQNNFCTQHVLPMFCKKKSFWQRFTCKTNAETTHHPNLFINIIHFNKSDLECWNTDVERWNADLECWNHDLEHWNANIVRIRRRGAYITILILKLTIFLPKNLQNQLGRIEAVPYCGHQYCLLACKRSGIILLSDKFDK